MDPWIPKTYEDKLLHEWWKRQPDGGTLYCEVGIAGASGGWADATERRLDGVIVRPTSERGEKRRGAFPADHATGAWKQAELVEVKAGLSEVALGQAWVGRWLFERQYRSLEVTRTVVVHRHRDPAMVWAAERLGIEVRDACLPREDGVNKLMSKRRGYLLGDGMIARLVASRSQAAGAVMTRVPLAGPSCGIADWRGSAAIYAEFVRLPGLSGQVILCEGGEHFRGLASRHGAEVVIVRPRLGRGMVGLAHIHTMMVREQYGVEASAAVVVERADPALREACEALGVEVRRVNPVDASPDEPDEPESGSEDE